jgi:Uma2 family endonuclease
MATVTESSAPRLGLESAGIRLLPHEFDALSSSDVDERFRYELVHGVLVVHAIPSEAEADPNEELGYLLRSYQQHHPNGSALDGTLPERYVRTADSRRRADRVIWAGLGRTPDPKRDVPTIVVEFVSAGLRNWRRDYEEKRSEYLALGVREYWIIDRFRRTMSVYRPTPPGPPEQLVAESNVFCTPLLPGFELPLAQLLAAADRWPEVSE